MVKNATRMDWNDRVPVNFAAIEAAEFEDEAAAAGAGKSVDAWRRSAKGGRRELADVVLDNPDAVFRVEPPSPQAHVTSLTADPYGWPMSSRLPKQAPMWMLYEAQRQEVPLLESAEGQGGRKKEPPAEIRPPMRDAQGRAYATGRRKTAAARVWVKLGDGAFTINGRTLAAYFPRGSDRAYCLEPLVAAHACGAFDVWLTVSGGGLTGQAGAIRHGLAKALARFDPYLKPGLKKMALLLRDPRTVERKKPGQKGARRKFQWVKR